MKYKCRERGQRHSCSIVWVTKHWHPIKAARAINQPDHRGTQTMKTGELRHQDRKNEKPHTKIPLGKIHQ